MKPNRSGFKDDLPTIVCFDICVNQSVPIPIYIVALNLHRLKDVEARMIPEVNSSGGSNTSATTDLVGPFGDVCWFSNPII